MDKKVKVCHVTSVHPSMDTRIFWKECISLSKIYDVSLIAPNTEERDEQGIHIYNVNLPKGRLTRQMYLNRVYEKMVDVDADCYHFHDPELMRLGVKMKKLGKIIIFDSHEDVPMQILCKEYLPKWSKKSISIIYSWYEKQMLRKYDAVFSVTPVIVERLKQINDSTYMITNYPVLEDMKPIICNKEKNICFAGGIAYRYMHENIIKAIVRTPANYILAGPVYPGYLERLQKLDGWKQVKYIGIVNYQQVYDIYKSSIAGVALLDYIANVGYHQGSLGVLKLFEYMMAGIPVIVTDFDIWKHIVEGYDCGICVNPHDIDAIENAINFFIKNPTIAREKGLNGRKAVEQKYNWSTQEKKLLSVYGKLLS